MYKNQKEITGGYQLLPQPHVKNADRPYYVENQPGNSNLNNRVGEKDVQKTTVFISPAHKLWKVHTAETNIGKEFILKSTAIAAAIKYVATHPEGRFLQIEIKGNLGNNYIYWTLGVDEFPPQKKPTGKTQKA